MNMIHMDRMDLKTTTDKSFLTGVKIITHNFAPILSYSDVLLEL